VKRKRRADTLAVDLGTSRCGVAALFRHYRTANDGHRAGYYSVEAWTIPLEDLGDEIRALHPYAVLAEESARGYRSDETYEAVKLLRQACKSVSAPLHLANVSSWKKEAFGSPRVSSEVMRLVTLERLRELNLHDPEGLYAVADEDHDAGAALRLLACWRPKKAVLSRGRSPTLITLGKRAYSINSPLVKRCSKSAQRLYAVLYEAATVQVHPGIRLQCKAAHIAIPNYRRFLDELVDELEIQLIGDHPITKIVL
jgi:hypothetical protein